MALNRSRGNMYGWVDYTWNPIKGRCRHDCLYCYMKRFPQGELRLDQDSLRVNLKGKGTVFVCSGNDLFAANDDWIKRVLLTCLLAPDTRFLFQTKNPQRVFDYLRFLPKKTIIGTTVETNRPIIGLSKAPAVPDRVRWLREIGRFYPVMISFEPTLDFDVCRLVSFVERVKPQFISIGADSKGHHLPEPSQLKLEKFILQAQKLTEVKIKSNLYRLGIKAEEWEPRKSGKG